jgi:tetratricopeptide (TPR) repeat protein
VQSPLRLMDQLEGGQMAGNTPRPSEIDEQFLTGMRLLSGKKFREADVAFKNALEGASKAVKDPKATKADIGRMGFSCFGRGYLFVCIGELKGAEQLYRKSLQFWSKIHGPTSMKLLDLMKDTVSIHRAAASYPSAIQIVDVLLKTVDGNAAETADVLCSAALCRQEMGDAAAAVAAWQTALEAVAGDDADDGPLGRVKVRSYLSYAAYLKTEKGAAALGVDGGGAEGAAAKAKEYEDQALCIADAMKAESL